MSRPAFHSTSQSCFAAVFFFFFFCLVAVLECAKFYSVLSYFRDCSRRNMAAQKFAISHGADVHYFFEIAGAFEKKTISDWRLGRFTVLNRIRTIPSSVFRFPCRNKRKKKKY